MTNHNLLKKARSIRSVNAQRIRETTAFTLCFRGGGVVEILGYKALAKYLRIKESSIPVLFSTGKGVMTLQRPSPLTGEPDLLTVTRNVTHKPKPKRGRPPKLITDNARLGAEFVERDLSPTPKSPHKRKPE